MHDEEHPLHLPSPDPPELAPIHAELANGHTLKLEARYWQRKPDMEELASGVWPEPYYSIRIYCTENALPKRLVWSEELRDGVDFDVARVHEIWAWLAELAASRTMFDFDGFDDFLHHVSEAIGHFSIQEPDAIEHYENLPGLTSPHSFDRIDDSVFNDQNEGDHEQKDPDSREE